MAAIDVTLGVKDYRFDCDSNAKAATKSELTQHGTITNIGSYTAFIKFFYHGDTVESGATIATDSSAAEGQTDLPIGCSIDINGRHTGFGFKTASTATVLFWQPRG